MLTQARVHLMLTGSTSCDQIKCSEQLLSNIWAKKAAAFEQLLANLGLIFYHLLVDRPACVYGGTSYTRVGWCWAPSSFGRPWYGDEYFLRSLQGLATQRGNREHLDHGISSLASREFSIACTRKIETTKLKGENLRHSDYHFDRDATKKVSSKGRTFTKWVLFFGWRILRQKLLGTRGSNGPLKVFEWTSLAFDLGWKNLSLSQNRGMFLRINFSAFRLIFWLISMSHEYRTLKKMH